MERHYPALPLGWIRQDRGLVVLALVGNIVTAWSWFGVNMLGIGLHSYGFMDSAFHTLKWFAVTQILLMMAACQPMMHWVSGASLAKTHDRTISMITAGVIGDRNPVADRRLFHR